MQADYCAALGADQVLGSDPNSPAVAGSLANNLISRVNLLGAPDSRHLLHLLAAGKQFHADGCGS